MTVISQIIIATLVISSGSLIGIMTLSFNQLFLKRTISALIALSAGTMLGAAFLHLLPDAISTLGAELPLQITLFAFISFFLIEKVLHWHHCHEHEDCNDHASVGYMNLLGDMLHNFLDGLLIAGAFLASTELGIAATLAIILHEIPQEIGDFGVLIHSGFSRSKALALNLLVSLTAVIGGLLGYFAGQEIKLFSSYLIPFAAGGFIYIAASDLVPEMKKTTTTRRTLVVLLTFLTGISLMYLVRN